MSGLSKETQQFLTQTLGANRSLSKRAMEEITAKAAKGNADWVDTYATARASQRTTPSQIQSTLRRPAAATPSAPSTSGRVAPAPGKKTGIRTQDTILAATDGYAVEQAPPALPIPDRNAEKDRLSSINEYGREGAARLAASKAATVRAAGQPGAAATAVRAVADPKESMIDQLIKEVSNRADFLEEMRAAGQGAKYEREVASEISQRMAQLRKMGVGMGGGPAGAGAGR